MRKYLLKYLFFFLLPFITEAQTLERSLNQHWKFHKQGDSEWHSAEVPGTVHTDLLNHHLIPDPFTGDNEKKLQWIENEDWEYKTTFKISKEEYAHRHLELQFDGLDTYAEVYVNDSLVLSADNMFRSWNTEIKKQVHPGKNELRIIFRSAVKKGKEEARKLSYTLPGDEKVFTRKAQYQYGWDWGPRYVTCGIWKNVKLISWDDSKMINLRCVQRSLTDSLAELEFICQIQSDTNAFAYLDVANGFTKDLTVQRTSKIKLEKGVKEYSIFFDIRNPQRWWTASLGFPVRYGFVVDLSCNSKVLDSKTIEVGLRTIELVRDKDSAGFSFYFKLNGIPVFMKGANYIPPDNFLPRVSKEDYYTIVKNAADANMNMLRVWGGGVYADDEFYKQCDQQGILVWQDLMFACAMYPGDEHFRANVAAEVKEQVQRLQNHPSIVLWCGNNEIDEGWKNWGWQKQFQYSKNDSVKIKKDYDSFFNDYLKTTFATLDPSRPYWPSSPSIGWGHPESLREGDSHYWGVWWGMEPFDIYKRKVGRFMSEYGFQGMPQLSTFKEMGFTTEPFDSLTFKAHQKHPTGYETIRTYMERDYKIPTDFENYSYVSQLLQADGMRIAIEAHRRAKPYCMGTLYWQLNDCWPVTSWSSVDHSGNWKAAHYEVKRAYHDVIVSVNETDDKCEVYIVSDLNQCINGRLDMKVMDFDGNAVWAKEMPVVIDSNSSALHYEFDKSIIKNFNKEELVLECTVYKNDYNSSDITTLHYFVKPKDMKLKKPLIIISKPFCEQVQCISLTSDVLAKNVCISIKGENIHLSDNFFDLLPGEEKTIYLPRHVRVRKLYKKIRIKSLADTY